MSAPSSSSSSSSSNVVACEALPSNVTLTDTAETSNTPTVVNAVHRILARATRILEITPIDGADLIELARVIGAWQVVISKKDNMKVGDMIVYFTIDSILDATNPAFDFLKDSKSGKMNRLRTKKIRKAISQGLVVPLSCVTHYGIDVATIVEDQDLTELLKVEKWEFEPEVHGNNGAVKRGLPSGCFKTGENRVQECSALLQRLIGKIVIVTRKEDGTSTSMVQNKDQFYVCGHNTIRSRDEGKDSVHYFAMCDRFDIEKKMKELNRNLQICGEIVGERPEKDGGGLRINGNTLKLKDWDFRAFYIWDIDHQRKLPYSEFVAVCDQMGLNRVPVVYHGPLTKEMADPNFLLKWAEDIEYDIKGVPAEGLVLATDNNIDEPHHSLKAISNKWLIKHDR